MVPSGNDHHNETDHDDKNETIKNDTKPAEEPVKPLEPPVKPIQPVKPVPTPLIIKPIPEDKDITNFFDKLQGNEYSHSDRFLEFKLGGPKDFNSKWLGAEFSLDFFTGLMFGDFPYFSQDVYQSDV